MCSNFSSNIEYETNPEEMTQYIYSGLKDPISVYQSSSQLVALFNGELLKNSQEYVNLDVNDVDIDLPEADVGMDKYENSQTILNNHAEMYVDKNVNITVSNTKANINREIHTSQSFPSVEEFQKDGNKLQLDVVPNKPCLFSTKLKKIFVKPDTGFYINALYNGPMSNLILRAMLVYPSDPGLPVSRCENHKQKDLKANKESAELAEKVLRIENSDAEYAGFADGKSVSDRMSVYIPLNTSKEMSIKMICCCQNSCLGRKPTAIIFTMEDKDGCVYCKEIINIKICACPSRDKDNEENDNKKKRLCSKPIKEGKVMKKPKYVVNKLQSIKKEPNMEELYEIIPVKIPRTPEARRAIRECAAKEWCYFYTEINSSAEVDQMRRESVMESKQNDLQ